MDTFVDEGGHSEESGESFCIGDFVQYSSYKGSDSVTLSFCPIHVLYFNFLLPSKSAPKLLQKMSIFALELVLISDLE